MANFRFHKISKTKKIRHICKIYKNAPFIVFLHGFMSDLEGQKPKTFLTFAKKNNSKLGYFIKFSKENLISKLRHLYANSLTKVSKIFNPILYLLILTMSLPVKSLDLEKSKMDNDVLKNINPKSIL